MSQYFEIHPDNPQARLVRQAVEHLRKGGVIVYPTDSSYALGCHIGDKAAMDRLRRIRRVNEKHEFTLVCRDLSEIGVYAKIDNSEYRTLKKLTPGAYTFLLPATSEVPRRLQHPKRKTIGLRVPENNIVMALLEELGEPIMSTTLIMPDEDLPLGDMDDIREQLGHQVDVIIDGGHCGFEPTSVIDMAVSPPVIARQGKGDVSLFE